MSKKKKKRAAPESLGLASHGVETHAHLDLEAFDEDLDEVVERARASGVETIGQVFLGPEAYEQNRGRFEGHDGFFYLLGVHPHDASSLDAECLASMRRAFEADPKLKAVGEIGLDYYYDYSPREKQREAFRTQLALAREVGRPVVIHSRDADDDTLRILEEAGYAGGDVLWHCFGRDAEFARKVLDNGWTVSIPGTVTYRKSDSLREAVAMVPLDRLVVETDCPFLAPEPYRGKRNEPAFCVFTAKAVADAKGVDVAEVWRRAGENARAFFGLNED